MPRCFQRTSISRRYPHLGVNRQQEREKLKISVTASPIVIALVGQAFPPANRAQRGGFSHVH
jgi:hypothetical protein